VFSFNGEIMSKVNLFRFFVIAFASIFVWSCSDQSVDHSVIGQLKIKSISQPETNIFTSGQPTKDEFNSLAELGVKHVINLRPASEIDWDEAGHVESLGMKYYSIPVAGAAGITLENATLLKNTLNTIGDAPILVHCSSSNRVGALIALAAGAKDGADAEAAINEGKRWGLTDLESVVRDLLSGS